MMDKSSRDFTPDILRRREAEFDPPIWKCLNSLGTFDLAQNLGRFAGITTHPNQHAFSTAQAQLQIGRSIFGNDLAFIDDQHSIAKLLSFRKDVRRKEYRALFADFADQVTHLNDLYRVQADRRFVQDQYLWTMEKRLC